MTYQNWCQGNLGLLVPYRHSCRGLCTSVSHQRAWQQHLRGCWSGEALDPCASPGSPWEASGGSKAIMSARPKSFKEEHPLGELPGKAGVATVAPMGRTYQGVHQCLGLVRRGRMRLKRSGMVRREAPGRGGSHP